MSTNEKNRQYHVGFSYFNKIGPMNLQKLENYFPNLLEAFKGSSSDLAQAGLHPNIISEFINWRQSFDLENILDKLIKKQINFVTWHDQAYPAILKEIPAPPPILYFKGNLGGEERNRLAVVGSREHSAYAEKVIAELLPTIIKEKIEIVSGLALGVDSLAHQATLNNQGITLAILGSGLDSNYIYPRSNYRLAENIISSGGALISEFPPITPPYKQNFPQRNRIISGLAQATLVIEAKAKSGSLITANYALEQNREVAAIPGSIFSEFSIGPNNLIAAGAKTVTNPKDVLEIFKIKILNNKTPLNSQKIIKKHLEYQAENKIEALVYDFLQEAERRTEKITADEIIKKSKLDTAIINSTLSILEIKGVAKNDESGYYLN
ncbi:MAG: DNA-processing protein DprA [Patescibacteria group bacterium]|jgi:DNA processing protein